MSYTINGDAMIRGFSVPTTVVEKSLKLADANALKVLLLIMSDTANIKTPKELSEILAIPLSSMKDIIHFWIGEGVLKSTEVVETSAEESEQLRALRQQLVSQNQIYEPRELAIIFNEKLELAEVRDQAEAMKGKALSHRELNDIGVLGEAYGLSGHFLLTVMGYCFETGKKDLKSIKRTAEAFFIQGIDEDTIDRYVEDLLNYHMISANVLKLLGIKDRHFNQRELKMLENWKTIFNSSDELIEYAHQISLEENAGAIVLRYHNSILERWSKAGITTIEQAKADTESFKQNALAMGSKPRKARAAKENKEIKDADKPASIYDDIENLIASQINQPW